MSELENDKRERACRSLIAVGYTGPKNFFFWCDVLCMSFGHRKQEKKLFLKNFHFWRLALPKTGENREIRDFWWFFG